MLSENNGVLNASGARLSRQQMIHERLLWESFLPRLLPPCRLKILMVTDFGGSFDNAGFGLSTLLNIMSTAPGPWVRFVITKAHRRTDASADIQDFRFDAVDLMEYHQIWMFGVERLGSRPQHNNDISLSEAELSALAQFMDQGGGVFATGDHEDLGVDMCGRVPRVRSMRRWYHPAPGPNGEPVAPSVGGGANHDTVTDTDLAMPGLQGTQSDDVPQTIKPRWYFSPAGLVWHQRRYPHPLLCGPTGPIRFLPDHMHEGLCEVPPDLSASFTFNGYTIEEYPLVDGVRLAPEVIADAVNNVNNGQFGVIAAYDGHRANVGRVVVDATWHHFFNINLLGFEVSADPVVDAKYDQIKAYFRNIAVWLAPPAMRSCMRQRALWALRWHYDLLILNRPHTHIPDRLSHLLKLGTTARDALGLLAPRCQLYLWVLELVQPLLPYRIDPWLLPPQPQPDPFPWLDKDLVLAAALGGVVDLLANAIPGDIDPREVDLEQGWIDELAVKGAYDGLQQIHAALAESARVLPKLSEHLNAQRQRD